MKLFSPGSGIVLTTYRIDTITQPFSPIAYCKIFREKLKKWYFSLFWTLVLWKSFLKLEDYLIETRLALILLK